MQNSIVTFWNRLWLYREAEEGACTHAPLTNPGSDVPCPQVKPSKVVFVWSKTHVHLRRWDILTAASEIPPYIFSIPSVFIPINFVVQYLNITIFGVKPPFFAQPQLSSVEEAVGPSFFFLILQDASRGLPETPPLQTYEAPIENIKTVCPILLAEYIPWICGKPKWPSPKGSSSSSGQYHV